MRQHNLRAALRPIVDLDGDAEPKLGEGGGMHAFGAAFAEDPRRETAERDRVETPLPRHQRRLREARGDEPTKRLGLVAREAATAAGAGEASGEPGERECKSRHRAAVDAHLDRVRLEAASLAEIARDSPLQRMLRLLI